MKMLPFTGQAVRIGISGAPGAGNDLQDIKGGVIELRDVVVVTKAHGDLARAAPRAAADFRAALSLMRPKVAGTPAQIFKISAMTGAGIPELWVAVQDLWNQF